MHTREGSICILLPEDGSSRYSPGVGVVLLQLDSHQCAGSSHSLEPQVTAVPHPQSAWGGKRLSSADDKPPPTRAAIPWHPSWDTSRSTTWIPSHHTRVLLCLVESACLQMCDRRNLEDLRYVGPTININHSLHWNSVLHTNQTNAGIRRLQESYWGGYHQHSPAFTMLASTDKSILDFVRRMEHCFMVGTISARKWRRLYSLGSSPTSNCTEVHVLILFRIQYFQPSQPPSWHCQGPCTVVPGATKLHYFNLDVVYENQNEGCVQWFRLELKKCLLIFMLVVWASLVKPVSPPNHQGLQFHVHLCICKVPTHLHAHDFVSVTTALRNWILLIMEGHLQLQ